MTIEEIKAYLREFCSLQDGCGTCPCKPDAYGNCYVTGNEETLQANYERVLHLKMNKDIVNHPSHYTQGGIECIDAMKSAFGADELAVYCKIAAFKYIWRCEHKNGTEDIKKAIWYLNKYLELFEGEPND